MAAAVTDAGIGNGAPVPRSNLQLRVISALVLTPVALAALWLGGWPFFFLVSLAAYLMLGEWASICGAARPGIWQVCVAAPTIYLMWQGAAITSTENLSANAFGSGLVSIIVVAAAVAMVGKWSAGWAALGAVYVALPCLAFVWLRSGGLEAGSVDASINGLRMTAWVFCTVWATDILAYVAGKSIGGPKLAPSISPGKTWAGLLGGMAGAAMVGSGLATLFGGNAWLALATGAATAVVAQAGDLAESAFKRRFGVKDSGNNIPGHGGVLDRVDALLVVAVAVAICDLQSWRLW